MLDAPDTQAGQPAPPVLSVRDLRTYFHTERGVVKSVDGVTFDVRRGETLAIVGESGSGKSVTSLSVMGLLPKPLGRIEGGEITFRDAAGTSHDLIRAPAQTMRRLRGNDIAMIFQEPMTSLNPVYSVGDQIAEAITLHQGKGRAAARDAAVDMLRLVGISAPEKRAAAYPHQLSGGMRQRVMIAMALSCRPALLIADEPTTALDVTIQAQILRLISDLSRDTDTAVMFITHNLGVVAEIADRVVIMYGGRVVEEGPVEQVFTAPHHPYTRGLLASIPGAGQASGATTKRGARLTAIPGNVPSPLNLPPGCAFAPRCEHARDACRQQEPPLEDAPGGRRVRCLRWREIA
ncbi:ABC transporter ATP-binding protein [Pseudoroseicyclus sp. H15]